MTKTILISPLDWGLGHATRMMPIIDFYRQKGDRIIIGGNGASYDLLQKKYPDLVFENIPGYDVGYSKWLPFVLKMLLSLPKIYFGIRNENRVTKALHQKYNFDLILSDNRFGVFVKGVKSIFVTHQLNIKFPIFSKLIFKIQQKRIEKFTLCLVPDFEVKPNLAGELSIIKPQQKLNVPIYYIGALSRFEGVELPRKEKKYKYLGIVSGPEPHRTELNQLLIQEFSKCSEPCAILTYAFKSNQLPSNVDLFLNASDEQFLDLLSKSEIIISRSGYTTLMDFVYLQKPAFFIPTPGQTEQIYLAEYTSKNKWADYCFQTDFSLNQLNNALYKMPLSKSKVSDVLSKL